MQLTAFQSDSGDCLLLESKGAKHRVLIDGGMERAYTEHIAPALGLLRKGRKKLDVVYVSHIDADHISGILQLLDDEAAWRVHEYQLRNGNPAHTPPPSLRPAEVGTIFHNSFHDQVGRNSGHVEDMLAATATILSGSEESWLIDVAQQRRDLVTSIPQALKVSQRIKPNQLNIPLNPEFAGKLMLVRDAMPDIQIGSIALKLIGPFREDVTKLRTDWNAWLRNNRDAVDRIRSDAERDQQRLGASEVDRVLSPLLVAAERLGATELAEAKRLGKRSRVTTPNLASLMFLAEENGQTILLTGDGHADDILKGLDHHNALDSDGTTQVDILKVQHHGSEHNIHQAFCDAVTADAYVMCGNGEHENPDLEVLQLIHDRRMAKDGKRFRFWFNSSSKVSASEDGKSHMAQVEALVERLAKKSHGRLTNHFIKDSSITIR